jgi:hypothetical protein
VVLIDLEVETRCVVDTYCLRSHVSKSACTRFVSPVLNMDFLTEHKRGTLSEFSVEVY